MSEEVNLLDLKQKVEDYKRFILEYGFNSEHDIFIKRELDKIDRLLIEKAKELKNED